MLRCIIMLNGCVLITCSVIWAKPGTKLVFLLPLMWWAFLIPSEKGGPPAPAAPGEGAARTRGLGGLPLPVDGPAGGPLAEGLGGVHPPRLGPPPPPWGPGGAGGE